MAKERSESPDPVVRVWTFLIRHGDPFTLTLPMTPILNHDGRRTFWKMVGTPSEAKRVEQVIESHDCAVKKFCEEQSEEQARERRALLGLPE